MPQTIEATQGDWFQVGKGLNLYHHLGISSEKEIGQKIDGKVKDLVEIVFYNLKNDAWSMNDLKDMIGAVKSARELKKRNIA